MHNAGKYYTESENINLNKIPESGIIYAVSGIFYLRI